MFFRNKNKNNKYIDLDSSLLKDEDTEGKIFICNFDNIQYLKLFRDSKGDYEFLSHNLSSLLEEKNYEGYTLLLIDLGNDELMEAFSKEIIHKEHDELLAIKGHGYKSFSEELEERNKYPLFISKSSTTLEYNPTNIDMVSYIKTSLTYKDEICEIIKSAKEKIKNQYESQIQSPSEYEYEDALLEDTIFNLKAEAKKYKNSLHVIKNESKKENLDS